MDLPEPQPTPTPYKAPDRKLGQDISIGEVFKEHYSQPLSRRDTYGGGTYWAGGTAKGSNQKFHTSSIAGVFTPGE
jgi:hypothetical protein